MDTYLTVQGNLVADPAQHSTASGATVVHFRVASSARRFDKQSGEFRDGDPMFMSVSCWRALAGNVMATLRKGDSVVVFGRLQFRSFEDKQGIRKNVHEIDALAVGPDLVRCAADLRRPTRSAPVGPVDGAVDGAVDGHRDDRADSTQPAPHSEIPSRTTAGVGSVAA